MHTGPCLHTLETLPASTRRASAVMQCLSSMLLPVVHFTQSWTHTVDLTPLLRAGHARELRSLARHACRKLASLVGQSAVWLGQSVDMARQVCGPCVSWPTGPCARFSLSEDLKLWGPLI